MASAAEAPQYLDASAVVRLVASEPESEELMAAVEGSPLSREVLTVAGALAGGGVRTVDALHVASALLVEDVALLVSYDARQLRAAAEAGLAIASPGRA